jgi:hypothetical protein
MHLGRRALEDHPVHPSTGAGQHRRVGLCDEVVPELIE